MEHSHHHTEGEKEHASVKEHSEKELSSSSDESSSNSDSEKSPRHITILSPLKHLSGMHKRHTKKEVKKQHKPRPPPAESDAYDTFDEDYVLQTKKPVDVQELPPAEEFPPVDEDYAFDAEEKETAPEEVSKDESKGEVHPSLAGDERQTSVEFREFGAAAEAPRRQPRRSPSDHPLRQVRRGIRETTPSISSPSIDRTHSPPDTSQEKIPSGLRPTVTDEEEEESSSALPPEVLLEKPTDYLCITARTALILPFAWNTSIRTLTNNEEVSPGEFQRRDVQPSFWVDVLLGRHLVDEHTGEPYPMWQVKEHLPAEIAELSPVFQQLVGFQNKKLRHRDYMTLWRCWRLELTKRAHQMLFECPKLWAIHEIPHVNVPPAEDGKPQQKCRHCEFGRFERIARKVKITNVEIILYPLGTGLLLFQIDWLPENTRVQPSAEPQADSAETLKETQTEPKKEEKKKKKKKKKKTKGKKKEKKEKEKPV